MIIEITHNDAVFDYISDKMKRKYTRTVIKDLPRLVRSGPGTYHLHTDRGDIAITTTITDSIISPCNTCDLTHNPQPR